jgi:hypothetical protein
VRRAGPRRPGGGGRGASRGAVLLAALGAVLAAAPARAARIEAHGYVKTQLSYHLFRPGDLAAADGRVLRDGLADARLELAARPGRWDLVAHLQVVGVAGDSPGLLEVPGSSEPRAGVPGFSGSPAGVPGFSGSRVEVPGFSGSRAEVPGFSGSRAGVPGFLGSRAGVPGFSGLAAPAGVPGFSGLAAPVGVPGFSGSRAEVPGSSGSRAGVPGFSGRRARRLEVPGFSGLAAGFLGLPAAADETAALDLDRTLSQTGSRLLVARLDRLSVGYTGDRLVLRLGRQALSWGDGLVFQVLDLFNPFPPNAADTEYKPGTDMLSGQWLFPSGDDLQALVVPRRTRAGGPLAAAASSFALKWHHFAGGREVGLLAARHYDDTVVGGGFTGDLAGGVWRFDATWTRLAGGGAAVSAVANLDHSWVWGGKNVYGFAEVYRNGFGATHLAAGLPGLDPALVARLERGEVFALGRDEVAAGARVELDPLTSLAPTLIANVHDGSGLALAQLSRDLSNDLRLDAGIQLPWGGRGSEFGGLAVLPDASDGPFLAPGRWLWVRLSRYF